jgi:hypothetical protein
MRSTTGRGQPLPRPPWVGTFEFIGDSLIRSIDLDSGGPLVQRMAVPVPVFPGPWLPYTGMTFLSYELALQDARRRAVDGEGAIALLSMLPNSRAAQMTTAWFVARGSGAARCGVGRIGVVGAGDGGRRGGALRPSPPRQSSPAPVLVLGLLGLVVAACHVPAPATGAELLAAAQRAMGATDTIRTLWAVASVASPTGGFEARIASARTGAVRLALGRSLVAGIHDARGWSCDTNGAVTALDSITRSVVRGHDLHMLVLSPSWLTPQSREPDQRWGQDSVMTVRFADELGAPLLLRLRVSDSMPVGLDLVNHTGSGAREVRVVFADWQLHHGVRLFRTATFEHGGDQFVYTYSELAINSLPDAAFLPGCSLTNSFGRS